MNNSPSIFKKERSIYTHDINEYISARFKTAEERRKDKEESLSNPSSLAENEWLVYMADGVRLYFKTQQDIFRMLLKYNIFYFIGIGFDNGTIVNVKETHIALGKSIRRQNEKIYNQQCCYCEIKLNQEIFTREHVIPKRLGGRIIKPCCKYCNAEKGGMVLDMYIKYLIKRGEIFSIGTAEYDVLQTKIKNAKEIEVNIPILIQ